MQQKRAGQPAGVFELSVLFVSGSWAANYESLVLPPAVIDRVPDAQMRQALGIAVFLGMAGVTILGVLLTPSFHVISRNFDDSVARRLRRQPPPAPQAPALAADRQPGRLQSS